MFLWENHDTAPFIRPVSGWEIIGYGKAPWPGNSKGFAAMLEKVTPATPEKTAYGRSRRMTFQRELRFGNTSIKTTSCNYLS